jgi:hypothetical protein
VYNPLLQIIVFSSLGLLIYLMARALPRINDAGAPARGPGFFDRLMSKLPMAKIDENINSFLAKFLRKSKIVVMKIDNFINHQLGKLTKKSGLPAGAPQSGVKGIGSEPDKTGENTPKLL